MWNLSLNRRDFIEFWLGGNRKAIGMIKESRLYDPELDKDLIHLQWETLPTTAYYFPTRIIGSDAELKSIFTALNASPTAATPVSAYSRVLTFRDYKYLNSRMRSLTTNLAPLVAMAMAECALLSEERHSWKQISLAGCMKTLSYTWGKAAKSREPAWIIEDLPKRWFETLLTVSTVSTTEQLRRTASAATGALNALFKITTGAPANGYPEALAEALYKKDQKSLNLIWLELAQRYGFAISLESLMLSTREDRASYLQQALKFSLSPTGDDTLSALCAFIATQVAPGSLEHLDLLRNSGNPEIVFWYAMYAALFSPNEIMGTQGGLGYRIYKMMATEEPKSDAPSADICYEELRVLERSGIDILLKKISHAGELQVELSPFVYASFNYNSAHQLESRYDRKSRDYLEYEYHQASRLNHEYRARVEQAISLLSGITNETSEGYSETYYSRRMGVKKKPTE